MQSAATTRRPALCAPSDDAGLMHRVQAGDAEAFGTIYDRHGAAVYRTAHRLLGDRAAAEDVTQETFLAAWRARDAYASERGSLRAWLLTVARNRAIDAIRRRPRQLAQPLDDDGEHHDALVRTEDEALRLTDAVAINVAMKALPEAQRRVLELAYFLGMSHTEIAAHLSIPLGTVKGRLQLAMQKLARQLVPPIAAYG